MKQSISNLRSRTDITQEAIAIDLGTNKSHISNIEAGRRTGSMNLYEKAFKNNDDPHFLNDLVFESTSGYGTPTPSDEAYCDHRLSIKYRLRKELREMQEALKNHRLDKHPDHLTGEEEEQIKLIVSEMLDVDFEINALLMKFASDYKFINLRKVAKNRNLRYVIEKRIKR